MSWSSGNTNNTYEENTEVLRTIAVSELSNNSNAPTVSVVIPLYNKGKYIERALSSVLRQTYQPLEIIVVDDGSADEGPERVLKFNDPKITLIRQENKGPGAARNAGLARAKCKYVAFLDADDEWLPSFLEIGLLLLENKEANVTTIWTGYFNYPDMRKNSIRQEQIGGVYEISSKTEVRLISKIFDFTSACFGIMRADTARKWGGFFDRQKCIHGEDQYFFYKLLFNERVGIINEPLGIYHREASDLTACGYKTPLPPPGPHLMDPREIIAKCPPEKRGVLRELLAIHALNSAKFRAKCGQGEVAREILERFLPDNYPFHKNVKIRFFIMISPILPKVRLFWSYIRSMKRLINRFAQFILD
jgi:glycosyltransferase involved in cell wall biosynthesis